MKENEFRIGNLVRWKSTGSIEAVWSIETFRKRLPKINYVSINDVEPIQLTEEWLIKFGLDCRDRDTMNHWHIGINDYTHDWLFDLKWFKYDDFPFYKNGGHVIKFVHQLQNLYYILTGEELIYKS